SGLGRWISPDWSSTPSPVPFADLLNPQSLNLYAYVGNDPISKSDDTGHGDAMTGWNQCMHSDACRAAHERAFQEHPVRSTVAPVAVMATSVVGSMFAAEGAAALGSSILFRNLVGLGMAWLASPGGQNTLHAVVDGMSPVPSGLNVASAAESLGF